MPRSRHDHNEALEVTGGSLRMSRATAEPQSGNAALRALPKLLHEASGWANLRKALTAGHSGTIDGAWGSSSALVSVALSEDVTGTLLIVVPNPADPSLWA